MYQKFCLLVVFVLFGLAAFSEGQVATQLVFRVGWETVYNVRANLDAKGMNAVDGKRSAGTTSSLTGNMRIRCVQVSGDTASFVMIVSDAKVGDGTSNSDFAVLVDSGKDKLNKHLGEPVVFSQKNTGEIVSVSFNHKDKAYYKNVKLGLINSLHTKLVPLGATQTIQDRDVVGDHKSQVSSSAAFFTEMIGEEMVTVQANNVQKTFDQTGFSAFPDPDLKPGNIKLQADTKTRVHSAGYIQSATVNQVVAMVNIGSGPAALEAFDKLDMASLLQESVKRQAADPTDLFLSSFGSMSIGGGLLTYNEMPSLEIFNAHLSWEEEEIVSGDLFESAAYVQKELLKESLPPIEIEETLKSIFEEADAMSQEKTAQTIKNLEHVINYLSVKTEDLSLLVPHLEFIQSEEEERSEEVAGLVLYILAGINREESAQMFIAYGLQSHNLLVQKAALLASHNSKFDNEQIIEAIAEIYEFPPAEAHKAFALLALGSVASRTSSHQVAKDILVKEAKESQNGEHEGRAIDAIFAIGNAGPSVFTEVEEVLSFNFQSHSSLKVQDKLVQMLQESFEMDYTLADADYPFSKSKTIDFKLGGKTVGARFQADAFLGTNFNCNQTSFNYKASGKASVNVLLFGKSKEAVGADAEYGQNGGSPLANSAHLRVWGKVIKTMNFPGLGDCITKTYPLGHIAPGFSVRYTIFVSVVPITFSASASLKLQLNWGWQVCPRDLYAEVSISPQATLVFSGDAKIDLLIIKAGTGLDGSLGAAIVPKAYAAGTRCLIGLSVDMVQQPLGLKLASYVQWKKCKLLIFDCKWGTRKEFVWFNWQRPAQNKNLWKQEFKIIKGGK
eukprot:TRINITY_DN577_c0_g1_i1.p1 TRINITY_DN577_c0_g1~~TRINITY_DN577_c0_g1_i1.p1  ORF type:complete len:841 (+),score=342.02 TRINITY_DN577_c0_g1_i1:80-2602(+)